MRSILVLLFVAVLTAAEQPADLGGPAPGLDGVTWKRGAAPAAGALLAVVVWPPEDGLDQPALELAPEGVVRVLLAVGPAEEVDQLAARPDGPALGIATPQVLERWLGSDEPPLPSAALVGADGVLLWRGRLAGLPMAVARERSGGFDRARLRETAALRAQLRAALAADPAAGKLPEALLLTARILVLEPVDEEALRLRLDVARHLGDREAFRRTLAGLPLDRLSAVQASELAWERATDSDLAWRHPDLALRLAEHAHALEPGDAEVEDTYARVLYLIGELDAALAAQLRAVSLSPDDAAMHEALDYYREVQALRLERQRALPKP